MAKFATWQSLRKLMFALLSTAMCSIAVGSLLEGAVTVARADASSPGPPSVESTLPDQSISGGTVVTIDGSNFTGATSVAFGSALAPQFSVISDTEISAVAPPPSEAISDPSAGTFVQVIVSGPSGSSSPNLNSWYCYTVNGGCADGPDGPHGAPGSGYWLVGSDGGVFSYGAALFHGSTGSLRLQRPIVAIASTYDWNGYWLVASDGGVFAFGDAGFYGSIPGLGIAPAGSVASNRLNAPIVAMVPSLDGRGYFLVASDGGVFAFGDAVYQGSCPGIGACAGPVSAVMTDGQGYWVVTTTGNVYSFGGASYYGAPSSPLHSPITSAVGVSPGYRLLDATGDVFGFGYGELPVAPQSGGVSAATASGSDPATAIVSTASQRGYYVVSAHGNVYRFGDAGNDGDASALHLNGSIIAAAGY